MRKKIRAVDLISNASGTRYISRPPEAHSIKGMSMDLLVRKILTNIERPLWDLPRSSHLQFWLSLCRNCHGALVMKTMQGTFFQLRDHTNRGERYFKFT